MCSWMYLKKFPRCYFQGIGKTASCTDDVLQGFAKCVMESQSEGEIIACNKEKEERRRLCLPTPLKRESTLTCNQCLGNWHSCRIAAQLPADVKMCKAKRNQCCPGCLIS